MSNAQQEDADFTQYVEKHRKAQLRLKKLFPSRKALFNNRVGPRWNIEDDVELENDGPNIIRYTGDGLDKGHLLEAQTIQEKIIERAQFPELIFTILMFFDIVFSIYFIAIGVTGLSWESSLNSIVDQIIEPLSRAGLQDNVESSEIMIMLNFNAQHWGIVLLIDGVLHIVSGIIGWQGAFRGIKSALFTQCVIAFILVVCEFLTGVIIHMNGACDASEFRKIYTMLFFNMYKPTSVSKLKVYAVEHSLNCCGIDKWTDYLSDALKKNSPHGMREDTAGDAVVFPPSCCNSWWIRNIKCAARVHKWSRNTTEDIRFIERRINPRGCFGEVVALCDRIVLLMGLGVLFAAVGHTLLFLCSIICIHFQIKVINKLADIRELRNRHAEDLCLGAYDELSRSTSQLMDFEYAIKSNCLAKKAEPPLQGGPENPYEEEEAVG